MQFLFELTCDKSVNLLFVDICLEEIYLTIAINAEVSLQVHFFHSLKCNFAEVAKQWYYKFNNKRDFIRN